MLGNSQQALSLGDIALKITFIEPYSGSTYCIISYEELVCDVMGSDGTKILQCQLGWIDTGDWYEFQKKYMESYWGDSEGGARRRYYRITEKGRQAYFAGFASWRETKLIIDKLIHSGGNNDARED